MTRPLWSTIASIVPFLNNDGVGVGSWWKIRLPTRRSLGGEKKKFYSIFIILNQCRMASLNLFQDDIHSDTWMPGCGEKYAPSTTTTTVYIVSCTNNLRLGGCPSENSRNGEGASLSRVVGAVPAKRIDLLWLPRQRPATHNSCRLDGMGSNNNREGRLFCSWNWAAAGTAQWCTQEIYRKEFTDVYSTLTHTSRAE